MIVSVGGGFIRVWRTGVGLAAEVPTCVVSSQEGIIALGDEAAAMEGKLAPGQEFTRPFFADRIIQREYLRELIRKALVLSGEKGSIWERLIVSAAIPGSTARLHKEWLMRTLREAGLGWIRPIDPLVSVAAKHGARQRKSLPIVGVVDWGFSALRAAIYVGDSLLASTTQETFGLRSLCQLIVENEKATSQRIFPLAPLYSLQWGLAHTGFDQKSKKSFTGTLQKEIVQDAQAACANGILQALANLQQQLSPEQASFFHQNGWVVIGGGASLVSEKWEKVLGVPVTVAPGATYASLQNIRT